MRARESGIDIRIGNYRRELGIQEWGTGIHTHIRIDSHRPEWDIRELGIGIDTRTGTDIDTRIDIDTDIHIGTGTHIHKGKSPPLKRERLLLPIYHGENKR